MLSCKQFCFSLGLELVGYDSKGVEAKHDSAAQRNWLWASDLLSDLDGTAALLLGSTVLGIWLSFFGETQKSRKVSSICLVSVVCRYQNLSDLGSITGKGHVLHRSTEVEIALRGVVDHYYVPQNGGSYKNSM